MSLWVSKSTMKSWLPFLKWLKKSTNKLIRIWGKLISSPFSDLMLGQWNGKNWGWPSQKGKSSSESFKSQNSNWRSLFRFDLSSTITISSSWQSSHLSERQFRTCQRLNWQCLVFWRRTNLSTNWKVSWQISMWSSSQRKCIRCWDLLTFSEILMSSLKCFLKGPGKLSTSPLKASSRGPLKVQLASSKEESSSPGMLLLALATALRPSAKVSQEEYPIWQWIKSS